MTPCSHPRRLLVVMAGVLGLLLGPASTRCEPANGSRGVLSGVVSGLSEDAEAHVELRRVADLRGARPWRRARPWNRDADPREYEPWLAAGRDAGSPVASGRLDGRAPSFRFEGLGPGLYAVRVTPTDGPAATVVAALWAEGQRVGVDVALPTGTLTLRVRVRASDGAPLRGFVVAAQAERGLWACPWLHGGLEAATDEAGLAVIDGLEPGPCEISALIPGVLRARGRPVELPFDGTYQMTVDSGPGLRGALVAAESDQPVRGAIVYAYRSRHPDPRFTLARGVSDEAGAFHLPAGGTGTEVLIVARGRAPAWLETTDENELGTIRLARIAAVSGWVRKPDGSPLPDVAVHAEPRWPLRAARPVLSTRSDTAGRYTLEALPPGEVRLFVRDDDWTSARVDDRRRGGYEPLALELAPGEKRRIDLEVVPAARLRGRALDAEGEAVSGALVRVWADVLRQVATDDDGEFEVGGLANGRRYDLTVRAPGLVDVHLEDLSAAADPEPVEVRFEKPFFVPVSVVAKGATRPVSRARLRTRQDPEVEVEGEGRPRAWSLPEAWTDARGRALLGPLNEGKAELRVSAPGYFAALCTLTAGPGAAKLVQLDPVAGAPSAKRHRLIAGRVIAPPGVVLGPVELLRSEPDEPLLGVWIAGGGGPVDVQRDGSFSASVPAPGRYGLRAKMVQDGALYWAQVAVEAGATDVEIRLQPAPWTPKPAEVRKTWRFRITDVMGAPVAGGGADADVRVLERRGVRCDANQHDFLGGRLEVAAEGDQAEATWLFRDAVDACGLWLPFGPARVGPVEPGGPAIEVVLPEEEVVTGVVLGPDGRGVRGVRVRARACREPDVSLGFNDRTALTREDGRFQLGGLGRGDHVFRLDVPDRMARVEPLLLAAGSVRWSDLRIRLHGAVAARVLVRDPDGKPLSGAWLRIEPDEDDFWTFHDNVVIEGFYSGPGYVYEETDAEGRAAFTRLDPERGYVLWVEPPKGRDDLAPLYLPTWTPRATQEIRLTPPAVLRGVVQDDSGMPVAGASVWIRQPPDDGFEERARSAADGTFTIAALRHGPVALVATRGARPYDDAPGILRTHTDARSVVLVPGGVR